MRSAVAFLVVAVFCALAAAHVQEEPACATCRSVAQAIINMGKNVAPNRVQPFLQRFCAIVPSTTQDLCRDMIANNMSKVSGWSQTMTADEICQTVFKVCPASLKRNVEENTFCNVCTELVQVAEAYAEQGNKVDFLTQKMNDLCAHLPPQFNAECKSLVTNYLPQIVLWVESNEEPASVCHQLSLCQGLPRFV